MNFIKPKEENNFLIVCEHCKAIVNFSREDCYCIKEVDTDALLKGHFQNVSRVLITCPNCNSRQDVAAGLRYVTNDKNWF